MIYRTKVRHDAFTFSLAGMPVMASFIAPPIIASDRISKAMDARLKGDVGAGPTHAPTTAGRKPGIENSVYHSMLER